MTEHYVWTQDGKKDYVEPVKQDDDDAIHNGITFILMIAIGGLALIGAVALLVH